MFSSQRQAGNCWNWPREIDASRILRFAVMCCRLPFLVYHSLCGFGSISVFAFPFWRKAFNPEGVASTRLSWHRSPKCGSMFSGGWSLHSPVHRKYICPSARHSSPGRSGNVLGLRQISMCHGRTALAR